MTFNKRKPAISEAARVAGREGSGEGHAGSSAPRKATGQDRHSKKDDRLEEHSTGRGPFQQRASFGAILADHHFSRDLAFAVWLPLVLAAFVTHSCGAPGAGPGACEAGRARGLALSSFPCGAHTAVQLLHVLAYLPWYLLARPVHVGDWVGLLSNAHHMAFTGLVLVLAVARRQGALWAWWRRHRVLAAWSTSRGGSTLLHLVSYPLLPRARWLDGVFGPYTLLVSTQPVASTLIYCALDLLVGLPFLAALAGILLHTVAVWVAAYAIAPHIMLLAQQQLAGTGDPGNSSSSSATNVSLLRCNMPDMSELVSCRPLWVQCLLAAFLVAFPIALASASQRWMWGRYRKRESGTGADLPEDQQQRKQHKQQSGRRERQVHQSGRLAEAGTEVPVPPGVGPPPPGDPLYVGLSRRRVVSVKVLHHPGTLEEFGPRLAAAVRQALREADREQRHPRQPQQHPQQRDERARQSPHRGSAAIGPGANAQDTAVVPRTLGDSSLPTADSYPAVPWPLPFGPAPEAGPSVAAGHGQGTVPAATPRAPLTAQTPRVVGMGTGTYRAVCSRWAVLRGCAQLVLWSGMVPRHRGRRHRGRLPDPDAPGSGSGSGSGTDGLSRGSDRTGAGGGGSGASNEGTSPSSASYLMAEAHRMLHGSRLGEGGMDQTGSSSITSLSTGPGVWQTAYSNTASPQPTGLQGAEGDAGGLAARMQRAVASLGHLSGLWVLVAGGGRRAVLRSDDEQGEGQDTAPGPAVELLRLYPPALALPTRGSGGQGQGEGEGDGQAEGEGRGLGEGQGEVGGPWASWPTPGSGGQGASGGGPWDNPPATREGEGQEGSTATGQAGQHEQQQEEEKDAGVQQGPDGRLSLVLRCPVAQAARLVVLREDPVAVAAGAHACGGLVAAEFPLQLAEGVQEVGVELTGVLRAVAGAEAGAEEDGAEAHEPPAEVLELMLLPPSFSPGGEEDPGAVEAGRSGAASGGSTAAPPLLHFTAPLLLLPAAAAAELRELDGRMREYVRAGQGLAAAEAGGVGNDATLPAAQGSTRATSPGPPTSNPSDESWGYWGEHMGPLLEDLALVLWAGGGQAPHIDSGGSGGGGGEGSSADGSLSADSEIDDGSVSGTGSAEDASWALRVLLPHLLAFLREQHMQATAHVLSRQPPGTPPPAPAVQRSAQSPGGRSCSGDLDTEFQSGREESPVPEASATATVPERGAVSAPTPAPAPTRGLNPGSSPPAGQSSTAQPVPAAPSLIHLIRGFQNPALERQYRAWRAAGLADVALPLVAAAAVPHAVALAAAVHALGVPLRQLAAAAWWSRVLSAVLLHAASWVGDVGGHLAVLVAAAPGQQGTAESNRASPEPREQEQVPAGDTCVPADKGAGESTPAPASTAGRSAAATAAAVGVPLGSHQERPTAAAAAAAPAAPPSLDRVYTLGAVVVGPLLVLLLSAAALLLQHGVPRQVSAGGPTASLVVAATRAVTGPCVQQLAAHQVALASPVLGVAEALLLGLLRPEWGRARVCGVVACWRLVALLLASSFEWRARRRFLRRLAGAGEGGSAGGQCVLAGAVRSSGAKLKDA